LTKRLYGRSGNKTAPTDTSTRAEVATVFWRYIENFLNDGVQGGNAEQVDTEELKIGTV